MSEKRVLLDSTHFQLTLERLARHLREEYGNFKNTVLVGIQPRGSLLAERLFERLQSAGIEIPLGKLDITFHRDDFRIANRVLVPDPMEMPFDTEGKQVILVDDVLYTGRTINAALSALNSFGRPSKVELLVLVDRRFRRQVPIAADYSGITVDALDEAYIRVFWDTFDNADQVVLYPTKEASKS